MLAVFDGRTKEWAQLRERCRGVGRQRANIQGNATGCSASDMEISLTTRATGQDCQRQVATPAKTAFNNQMANESNNSPEAGDAPESRGATLSRPTLKRPD